jgi:hypothetical protein
MFLSDRRTFMTSLVMAQMLFSGGGPGQKNPERQDRLFKSTLRRVYEQDQAHRGDEAGDAKRREYVRQLINRGEIRTGLDYYYAAFIFQHGQKPDDYLLAHVLAVTAVNKGVHNAMWLSAATLDRYLHSIDQPQVFGTQFGSLRDNRDDQQPYDSSMLSDAIRAQWCVASGSVQSRILNDIRAGREFQSTRICPLPDSRFDAR